MNDFLQSLRNGQAEKPRTPKTRKNVDSSYQYTNNSRFNSYGGGGYQSTRNHQMKRPPSQGIPHQGGNQIPIEDANITLLADVLDNLSSHVETLVKNQEYMVNIQERTADMLERQANAIELIVKHLNLSPNMELDIASDIAPDIPFDRPSMMPQVELEPQPVFKNHYVTPLKPQNTQDENRGNTWADPITAPVRKPVLRKRKRIVTKEIIAPNTTAPNTTAPESPKSSKKPKTPTLSDVKLMPRHAVMEIIQSMREEGATFDQVAKRLVELEQPTFSGRGEWHAQTIHRLCSKK